eukprot:543340-Hanusia_phi.AAC.1
MDVCSCFQGSEDREGEGGRDGDGRGQGEGCEGGRGGDRDRLLRHRHGPLVLHGRRSACSRSTCRHSSLLRLVPWPLPAHAGGALNLDRVQV